MNIVELLISKNLKITTAESCTGGMVAQLITDTSGASACFEMGFVTYSDRAKAELLGVREDTLGKYTAISQEVAKEMAEGALNNSGADIAVSVTGNAGPNGLPLGKVYIGISGIKGTFVYDCFFTGDRGEIRDSAARKAIEIAQKYIVDYYS